MFIEKFSFLVWRLTFEKGRDRICYFKFPALANYKKDALLKISRFLDHAIFLY